MQQEREVVVDAQTSLGVEYEGKWTQSGVEKVREWVEETKLMSACHEESSNFFNLMYRTVGTTNILSAAAASALSFLAVGGECDGSTPKLSVLTVFSAVTVVSAGVNAFFVWNLRSMMHLIMSNEYSTLSKDLAYELSLPMHAREDLLLVFARTSAKLKELAMRSNIVPPWIASQVKRGKRGCCSWLHPGKRRAHVQKQGESEV